MEQQSASTPPCLIIDSFWDAEAGVWVAVAREDIGLVTEARTFKALRRRLRIIAADFLEEERPVQVRVKRR